MLIVGVRSGSGNVFQGRTVVGAPALSGDLSYLAEGFLFFRIVLTIFCASTTARGSVYMDALAKWNLVADITAHAERSRPRHILPPLSNYECNEIIKLISLRRARNIDFGPDRRISRGEVPVYVRSDTEPDDWCSTFCRSALATNVVISVVSHIRKPERSNECVLSYGTRYININIYAWARTGYSYVTMSV
jgi:hypothetical protein